MLLPKPQIPQKNPNSLLHILCYRRPHHPIFPFRTPPKFSIIINASSMSTRIHIFGFRIQPGSASPIEIDLKATAEMKVRPRLLSYAKNPERVGESLMELMVNLGLGDGEFGDGDVMMVVMVRWWIR